MNRLGQISYSVFLVHFAVCVAVNAVVSWFWPQALGAAAAGMVLAFALSIAAGHLLYERVECQLPSWQEALRWMPFTCAGGAVARPCWMIALSPSGRRTMRRQPDNNPSSCPSPPRHKR